MIFALLSCSFKTHYIQTGSTAYEATDVNKILIFSKTPEKKYQVIGSIAAFGASEKLAIKALKKKAAELGADAVIEITLDKISTYNQSMGISGVAVKFK